MNLSLNKNKCYLCDISAMSSLRVYGSGAMNFLNVMASADFDFASRTISKFANVNSIVSQYESVCIQGLFLNSLGEIIDLSSFIFTSLNEIIVIVHPNNKEELKFWLEEHLKLKDSKGKIFEDVAIDDISFQSALLIIFGNNAKDKLNCLIESSTRQFFTFSSLINCSYGLIDNESFLIDTSVKFASQIGDYFADFKDVEALDIMNYKEILIHNNAFKNEIYENAYVSAKDDYYNSFLRKTKDFVGAKALF